MVPNCRAFTLGEEAGGGAAIRQADVGGLLCD